MPASRATLRRQTFLDGAQTRAQSGVCGVLNFVIHQRVRERCSRCKRAPSAPVEKLRPIAVFILFLLRAANFDRLVALTADHRPATETAVRYAITPKTVKPCKPTGKETSRRLETINDRIDFFMMNKPVAL